MAERDGAMARTASMAGGSHGATLFLPCVWWWWCSVVVVFELAVACRHIKELVDEVCEG